MSEYIEREAALKCICSDCFEGNMKENGFCGIPCDDYKRISKIPAADVRPVVRGKWEDVHIDRPEIADLEVASMFCPNCNRWHNEVYHYGNPIEFANFCQFCGADMRGES